MVSPGTAFLGKEANTITGLLIVAVFSAQPKALALTSEATTITRAEPM